jgi:hypothetical protein
MRINGNGEFGRKNISDQKRLIRTDFYLNARKMLGNKKVRGLIFPGTHPYPEVISIREVFDACHITAIDTSAKAVTSARMAGVDEAILGNLAKVNQSDCEYHFGSRKFDFINADMCGVVSAKNISVIEAAAKRTDLLCVFVAYGHDETNPTKWWGKGWHKRMDEMLDLHPDLEGTDQAILTRLMSIWLAAKKSKFKMRNILRVYNYRGNVIPMLGAVISADANAKAWDPLFLSAQQEDLGAAVLRALKKRSTDRVCAMYDVTPRRVAAFKANATRRARV